MQRDGVEAQRISPHARRCMPGTTVICAGGRGLRRRHQKLHTNCAPDDIIIAEAYIRFLESNNPDAYWGHLKANGLSWEYM